MALSGPEAPGGPGKPPLWAPAGKTGVGTSLGAGSRVWFTISEGIITEIFYPELCFPCIKSLKLLMTSHDGFVAEEQHSTNSQVTPLAAGVPAYRIINSCRQARFRIEKEVFTDPARDVVLQQTLFVPLQGKLSDYRVYVLFAPHLGERGDQDYASVGDYKVVPMLLAQADEKAVALACSAPWLGRSVGYAGTSDGWRDVSLNKCMTQFYDRAGPGNVALIGEIDLQVCEGRFLLALGFGSATEEAGHHARAGILDGARQAREEYIRSWNEWQESLPAPPLEGHSRNVTLMSRAVLRVHEGKSFPGSIVASLATPWGFAHGEADQGGYHLVWPRDLVEAAGGLIAVHEHDTARRILTYLQTIQESDGHWLQNYRVDGSPFSRGLQLDETSLPILLVDLAYREHALDRNDLDRYWPMVHQAAKFLLRHGPVTEEDRWERNGGYAPFTLAAGIAALLVAAEHAELQGEAALAESLCEEADARNAQIEDWLYVTDTPLARRCGVEGYYVRIAPAGEDQRAEPLHGIVPVTNRPPSQDCYTASHLVSPDALALVRFGLRAADDHRIRNTVRVIDELVKFELPAGLCWRRYNEDGYGESADGSPFLKYGIGRAWPLLSGERGHFELAAGRKNEAGKLLQAMAGFACESGLIPEQVWDAPDLPEHGLAFGRPSGSAMPLVWAHAEYLKLMRSLEEGRIFDRPPQTVKRYLPNR